MKRAGRRAATAPLRCTRVAAAPREAQLSSTHRVCALTRPCDSRASSSFQHPKVQQRWRRRSRLGRGRLVCWLVPEPRCT
ncbi:hypothetical protein OEZ85_008095 [Tetradesmus obliquus]|uniref:Uncharacterized protein n=1 Tax=Tetradesmus obliquus TaxID=3088 RepID=A0ABY8THW4_TETOB|nr:hypothetical protein OEZ85_008095 [Tetradesmus obliquus]